jgi:hypothetical protein
MEFSRDILMHLIMVSKIEHWFQSDNITIIVIGVFCLR